MTIFLFIVIIVSAFWVGYSSAQAIKHRRMSKLIQKWQRELKAGTLNPEKGTVKAEVLKELKEFKI